MRSPERLLKRSSSFGDEPPRPRAFGGKGAEGMKKGFPISSVGLDKRTHSESLMAHISVVFSRETPESGLKSQTPTRGPTPSLACLTNGNS